MTSSETPPASVGAAADAAAAAAAAAPPPSQERMVSKRAFRVLERNSGLLFALANSSKGSQVSRLSLAANELLREICERKVDKGTLAQLEFYASTDRLNEPGAEPVIFLAQSILAMGRSVAGVEGTVGDGPAAKLKPPLNFDDGDDDALENMLATPSGTWAKPRRQIPLLFRNEDPAVDGELDISDHTETSGSSGEKHVSARNDWCTHNGPVAQFRPLTPEGEQRDDPEPTPSPPPSPTLANILKKRRRGRKDSEDTEEDEDDLDDEDTPVDGTTASSSVDKDNVQCPMCDTFFFAQHQLDSHLVGYHRMKPTFDDTSVPHDASQSATPSSHLASSQSGGAFGGSAVIGSTRPLNGFGLPTEQKRLQAGGVGQVRSTEHIRLGPTTVTSPGGTIRHYSSPSNAARAAAKAAAAAANGVFRPNVPSKPYTCRQCGMVLQSQQMYASHVRYNHPKDKMDGGTPVVVRQKSATNSNKETAIVHLQMDDGSKAFKCRRCEKVFDSAQKVAGHSRHCLARFNATQEHSTPSTGTKTSAFKRVSQASPLVFEGKARPATQGPVPTEDRPYTVYRCGLNSDLARTCPYCGELLPSIRKVDKHVRMMHEASRHEVYGCSTCDRRFVTLGGIENHWLHYGDCPQGVLTVHKDGVVTCADIGDIPPPLKRPKLVLQAPLKKEEDEDPSVSIVNAILGAHGFKVPGRDAPALSPEPEESERMEDGEDEEAAPDLDEYGEEEHDGMDDFEAELRMVEDEEEEREMEEKPVVKKEKIIVSMKLMRCRHCDFAARSREGMDAHMIELHPSEALADESAASAHDEEEEEEDGLPTTSTSPEINDDAMNGSSVSPNLDESANGETAQTGEMRRMLGISSD